MSITTSPSINGDPGLSSGLAAAISSAGVFARPKICFFGDSTVQYNVGQLGQKTTVGVSTMGATINVLWADLATPPGAGGVGAGQITYDATAKTMYWTAAGDTAGAAVDVSRHGMYKLPSGTAGYAVYVVFLPTLAAYVSGTQNVAVSALGSRVWSYMSKGVGLISLAVAQQRFTLAPFPTSCPPGMDGFYGLGGCTAGMLLDAQWQWSQISSDIDVIQVGTNGFGTTVTPAQYLIDIKAFITARLAQGTSLVIWQNILPRNTAQGETATTRKGKALVTLAMREWAATMGGRVAVFDVYSYVSDSANNGDWLSGYDNADGVHPSVIGAWAFGVPFGNYLSGIADSGTQTLAANPADIYDATTNPSGNLIAVTGLGVPLMVGAAGTVNGAAAGSAATSWTLNSTADLVATGSKQTRTDGIPGEWQKIVLGGATSTKLGYLLISSGLTTGLVVGGYYQAELEIQIVASSNLNYLEFKITPGGIASFDCQAYGFYGQGSQAFPNITTPQTLWLKTPPQYIAYTGTTSLQPSVNFGTLSGGSATILIGRMRLYKTG